MYQSQHIRGSYIFCVGYYCRSGAFVSTPEEVPPINMTAKMNGTNCTCPQCECTVGAFNKTNAGPCPKGFFCPNGTDEPYPCPRGSYSNITKLKSEGECNRCPPGQYCGEANLTAPSGNCFPAFYCTLGASNATEYICPKGSYCEVGSYFPTKCPNGTFRNATHGKNSAGCFPCPGGKFCNGIGLEEPSGDCAPG